MGLLEGNQPATDNDWESVTRGGDAAIQRWIDAQLTGKSCAVVLIGSNTAGRKWINYEITKAWNDGKGVFGIYIHKLLDNARMQSTKGGNPFDHITFENGGASLSSFVHTYNPPFFLSTDVYAYIKLNLGDWVDKAVALRNRS